MPKTTPHGTTKDGGCEDEFEIVNAYYDIVTYNVRQLMKNMNMCDCEKCYKDACAIVFNTGYTNFVVKPVNAVLTKYTDTNPSEHIKLVVTIAEALKVVQRNPQHKK